MFTMGFARHSRETTKSLLTKVLHNKQLSYHLIRTKIFINTKTENNLKLISAQKLNTESDTKLTHLSEENNFKYVFPIN